MLVELLRPLGPELARRWLAALLAIPAHEREAAVIAIEARVAEAYNQRTLAARKRSGKGGAGKRGKSFDVLSPPVQREGYTEQVVTTYEVEEQPAREAALRKRRASGA
jgi:hypothetical protein